MFIHIIIINLSNEIPYIYKAVSTLPVHGEYNLLNLDKGQLCRVSEKVYRAIGILKDLSMEVDSAQWNLFW